MQTLFLLGNACGRSALLRELVAVARATNATAEVLVLDLPEPGLPPLDVLRAYNAELRAAEDARAAPAKFMAAMAPLRPDPRVGWRRQFPALPRPPAARAPARLEGRGWT